MNNLDLIRRCLRSDVPIMLWGAPGVGKTATIEALAAAEGAHLETLIGSTLDPVDVGGFLIPAHGEVRSVPPPWAQRINEALAMGQKAWLFLDELSCAPPSVQAALLRVVQSRMVGNLAITGCKMLAAANPAEHAADGGWLPPATANRWAHIDYKPDPSTWVSGTLAGWGQPYENAHQRNVAARISGWIRHSPASLLVVPEGEAAGRAWPSPRAWSALVRALGESPCTKEDEIRLAGAIVGEGITAAWAAFDAALDLPDPEEVLAGNAKVPTRGDRAMTTLGSVVLAAMSDHPNREGRIEAAWKILASQRPDVALAPAAVLLEATGDVPDEAAELGRRLIGVGGGK